MYYKTITVTGKTTDDGTYVYHIGHCYKDRYSIDIHPYFKVSLVNGYSEITIAEYVEKETGGYTSIMVDSDDGVYVLGYGLSHYGHDSILLNRFDDVGNRIWQRKHMLSSATPMRNLNQNPLQDSGIVKDSTGSITFSYHRHDDEKSQYTVTVTPDLSEETTLFKLIVQDEHQP